MLLSTPIDGSESKVETEAKSGDLTLIGFVDHPYREI